MLKPSTKSFFTPTLIGTWYVLFSAVLFSTKSVFVKMAYQYAIDATILLSLRMMFALPFFLVMLYLAPPVRHTLNTKDYLGLWLAGVLVIMARVF
ncbi:MAG: hypothetical protein IPM78_13785 [Moraxellaceae bacterium]|nr:hypothetical protein [Moraxellaceae bacterium]